VDPFGIGGIGTSWGIAGAGIGADVGILDDGVA
jgi:hypothetical protein